jgi:hypothetical protein
MMQFAQFKESQVLMKKNDMILIGIVLIVSLIALGTIKWFQSQNDAAQEVLVKHNGVIIKSFKLTEKTNEEFLYDEDGEINRIVIKDGVVSISEANCRDQICVKTQAITQNGGIIVCLPHKVTVEIFSENAEEDGLDSIAD